MKKIYVFFSTVIFLFFFSFHVFGQPGQWVWIHGSNTTDDLGNFGVQGVPSQLNEPPALYEPCEWKDLNGKFWFYGGLDDNLGIKIHNDLWKFDPVDSTWTWIMGDHTYNEHGYYGVQGVPSPANFPPGLGYGVATWVDLSGDLWMFGGWCDSTYADLWRYNIASASWTWMKGPGTGNPAGGVYGTQGVPDIANYPPARSECAATWVDKNGDLWMFGGYIGQIYNDLWRYNIASNTWTWMKGSNLVSQHGSWGTMGVESSFNEPSARRAYCHWVDNAGNFWMYGGIGFDAAAASWELSDLWRYNPCSNNWTWMNGQNYGSGSNLGAFGTKCSTAPSNQPPPRFENRACWTDPHGDFWMWGGQYQPGIFTTNTNNDLWRYCASSNQWTWEGGDNVPNLAGNWGTLHVPSPANKPDGRTGSVGWIDNWNLYLFGGSAGAFGNTYNDLWRFAIDTTCGTFCPPLATVPPSAAFQSSDTDFCAGNCINFTDLSTHNPSSWNWTFTGAIPSSSSDQNPQGVCYLSSGSYNVTLTVAVNGACGSAGTITNQINVFDAPPTPTLRCSNDTLYCSIDTAYRSYQWYDSTALIVGATNPSYYISKNGNYNVAVSNVYSCSVAVGISTNGCLTGINNLSESPPVSIYPNPANDKLLVTGYPLNGKSFITIFNILGETLYKEELTSKQEIINCKSFAPGVYFILITNQKERLIGRFVKE